MSGLSQRIRWPWRRAVIWPAAVALGLNVGGSPDAQTRAADPGWQEISNTQLRRACPPNGFGGSGYPFTDQCRFVVDAWNSAILDEGRKRLILWGGGHNDYAGNELYALDLTSFALQRLTDPGLPLPTKECPEAIAGGSQPNSRHTYDAIAYMSHVDRMFVFGGSLSPCGNFSNETWTFSFAESKWERRSPRGSKPRPEPGAIAVYDPVERRVLVHDSTTLYAYDFESNRYRDLSGGNPIDYHLSGVIHPRQRKLVLVGTGRVYVYDLGPKSWHWRRSLSTKGGDAIVNSVYPGLAYDPVSDRIVAWNGGDVVYSLDLDTKIWTPMGYPGGPPGIPENGTFKRWAYVGGLDLFVVVHSGDGNVFVFRPPRPDSGHPVQRHPR